MEKVVKPQVVQNKIQMNADDWKSMFSGGVSENYQKQVEEEKLKADEEKKKAEAEAEAKAKEATLAAEKAAAAK